MPSINHSHHDWSIPQAKQILSHWATLATLLAGTQATLLGYYEKDDAGGTVFNFVIASSCAGLFLEVYGALLAAATIIASISLQAPTQANTISSSSQSLQKKHLSPRATAILDRLTVACGYIIPLGAIFELIGLGTFAAKFQDSSVMISMIVTLAFCVCTTGVAALFGWKAGSDRKRMVEEMQNRAQYWNAGRQYTTPPHHQEGPKGEQEGEGEGDCDADEEGIALINSTR